MKDYRVNSFLANAVIFCGSVSDKLTKEGELVLTRAGCCSILHRHRSPS
jgi:hypothetical protein